MVRKGIALAELCLLGSFGHRCDRLISEHSCNNYHRNIWEALHQQRWGRTRQSNTNNNREQGMEGGENCLHSMMIFLKRWWRHACLAFILELIKQCPGWLGVPQPEAGYGDDFVASCIKSFISRNEYPSMALVAEALYDWPVPGVLACYLEENANNSK